MFTVPRTVRTTQVCTLGRIRPLDPGSAGAPAPLPILGSPVPGGSCVLKRLTTAAVGVVGLVVIGLGIASATVWRADDVLVATTSGGAHTLVDRPRRPGARRRPRDRQGQRAGRRHRRAWRSVATRTSRAGWAATRTGRSPGLSAWHTLAVDDVAAPAPDRSAHGRGGGGGPPAAPDAATPAPTEGAADATADRPPTRPAPTCGSREADRDRVGRAGLAGAGGPMEPARRQHGRVRPHACRWRGRAS